MGVLNTKKLKIIAIIEVRMNSSRLPGKALIEVEGKPILEHVVNRIRLCEKIDEIVIATTVNSLDDPIDELAKKLNIECFRGSEEDVLLRVINASEHRDADLIVLSGGDSPFFDWEVANLLINKYFEDTSRDLVLNSLELTFPLGVYAHVVPLKILKKIESLANTASQREDTLRYIFENPDQFNIYNLAAPDHLRRPDLRLTIDYREDVILMQKVYENVYAHKKDFTTQDVIKYLEINPGIADLNKDCVQMAAPHTVRS